VARGCSLCVAAVVVAFDFQRAWNIRVIVSYDLNNARTSRQADPQRKRTAADNARMNIRICSGICNGTRSLLR